MTNKLNKNINISDEAVRKATGKSWDEWFALIEKEENGRKLSHKDIATLLTDKKYLESTWWAQSVTVAYEYEKGRRVKGETKDAGFQVGIQKMVQTSPNQLWKFLTSAEGRSLWLGEAPDIKFEKGHKYQTKEGIKGEIRSIVPRGKIRLTWQPKYKKESTTLQLYFMCTRNNSNKTNLRLHQEKLRGAKEREKMKQHWKEVLQNIESHLKDF